jgi:hypothetical protein
MEKLSLPSKFYVRLSEAAREVLPALAEMDRRYPGQQIDWLIVEEAQRRGLLTLPNRDNFESAG